MDGMVIVKDIEDKVVRNALRVYKALLQQSVRYAKNQGVAPLNMDVCGIEFIDALLERFEKNQKSEEE